MAKQSTPPVETVEPEATPEVSMFDEAGVKSVNVTRRRNVKTPTLNNGYAGRNTLGEFSIDNGGIKYRLHEVKAWAAAHDPVLTVTGYWTDDNTTIVRVTE